MGRPGERKLLDYQVQLISSALSTGALKFGSSFVLKSGRVSPYFFLVTEMNSGRLINDLAAAYATFISSSLADASLPPFDVLFGPAYKGIPLAATVALLLWRDHGMDVSWAYDRKEAKDHGEGGVVVGAQMAGKRVLILDDVVTAGTAIRVAVRNITAAHGKVVAVVECLDREEVSSSFVDGSPSPRVSTMDQVAEEINGPVKALVGMRDLMSWLRAQGREEDLKCMEAYWQKYGVGDT